MAAIVVPEYTYTGDSECYLDTVNGRWVLKLLSSGDLTFPSDVTAGVACVGGGTIGSNTTYSIGPYSTATSTPVTRSKIYDLEGNLLFEKTASGYLLKYYAGSGHGGLISQSMLNFSADTQYSANIAIGGYWGWGLSSSRSICSYINGLDSADEIRDTVFGYTAPDSRDYGSGAYYDNSKENKIQSVYMIPPSEGFDIFGLGTKYGAGGGACMLMTSSAPSDGTPQFVRDNCAGINGSGHGWGYLTTHGYKDSGCIYDECMTGAANSGAGGGGGHIAFKRSNGTPLQDYDSSMWARGGSGIIIIVGYSNVGRLPVIYEDQLSGSEIMAPKKIMFRQSSSDSYTELSHLYFRPNSAAEYTQVY